MSIIRLLPDHIANQIAAGEVIQRPASVVKELVENAIDAGAQKINVHIKDAGKTLIQVVDEGRGMAADDARMCFERHATSKVASADDLFALKTKGFRGEALASIAAIAHVTLKTRQPEDEIGTLIRIEGSRIVTREETVCPIGSSFEVKNLFYNVPARRNFLKTDAVEFRHICDEFERVALAHPDIEFTLDHNGSQVHNLPSSNLRKRIVSIFGNIINDKLVPIEEQTDIVRIHGFIGKPEYAKKKRGEQFFFVNNRFFKDSYFNHALTSAYDNLLAPKTFASYFLFFEIDPQRIDVNVHPTKTEIKFEEDRFIYTILKSAIRQALGKYNIAPTLDFEQETGFDLPYEMKYETPVEPTIRVNPDYNPFREESNNSKPSYKANSAAMQKHGFGKPEVKQQDWQNFYEIADETHTVPSQLQAIPEEEASEALHSKNVLEKGNYLITEGKTGLMMIHRKRGLHRVVYDQMMQTFIAYPVSSQTMLFPIEKEMSRQEAEDWKANASMLERLGFRWQLTEHTLSIEAIPAVLEQETVLDCLEEINTQLGFPEIEKGEVAHYMINSIAKAASMRKTEKMNPESFHDFMEKLFACEDHMYTPDGLKIMSNLTLDEIRQKF